MATQEHPEQPMPEQILEILAEGGGIRLLGVRTAAGWRFRRYVSDWTPELLDEPWIVHDSREVETWEAALELLDNYPWPMLVPRTVHPEFRTAALKAIEARLDPNSSQFRPRLARWQDVCA